MALFAITMLFGIVQGASAAALSLTTSSLASGAVGKSYTATLAATGGTTPYKWSVASGALPTGLTLSTAGKISGKPTAPGSFTFSVQVKDAASATSVVAYDLVVTAPPLVILYPNLNPGMVGSAYTATLYASGGTGAYTWTLISGALTPGLTLSTAGNYFRYAHRVWTQH